MNILPIEQKTVVFNGAEITAVLVQEGQETAVYIPLRPIVENLGLSWPGQRERVNRDQILTENMKQILVASREGSRQVEREVNCLHLDYLGGFLFGINAKRVKAEVKDALLIYQARCYKVIRDAFVSGQLTATPSLEEIIAANPDSPLVQAYQQAQAIVRLAENQLIIQSQIEHHATQIEDHGRRLELIEANIGDEGRYITEAQATNISQAIKAIAIVEGKRTGRNEFGSTYGELYRRYKISAYRRLPAAKYEDAMQWLTEWWNQLTDDNIPF